MQAVKGFFADGRFTPENSISLPDRVRAILVLEEQLSVTADTEEVPAGFLEKYAALIEKVGIKEALNRVNWLERLREARELVKDAPPFDLPPRAGGLRPPVLLED